MGVGHRGRPHCHHLLCQAHRGHGVCPREHRHVSMLLETPEHRMREMSTRPWAQCQGPGGTAGPGSDAGGAALASPPTCWDLELLDVHLSVHPPSAHIPSRNARVTDTSVQPGIQQTLSAQYRAAIVISKVSRPDSPVSWLLEIYLVCGGAA